MWTPKRIVLLAAGFLVFFSGYTVYARILGGIDGLPPLPVCYLEKKDGQISVDNPYPVKHTPMEHKLQQAFGPDCQELNRPIKLELHAKRTILAADQFIIEQDGRVQLTPLSLALFGADRGDGHEVEINTLCAERAYLRFDRRITNISEIGNCKIIEAELYNKILVTNNRRTAARDDDLHVYINNGPLYYNEAKHLIWTKDDVRLKDFQSKPKPNEISGHMMDMELAVEAPPSKPGAPRKARGETITGVKSIVLHSGVRMDLYVDGQSGFPGGARAEPATAPVAKPGDKAATPAPEKARVIITCPGQFRYEVYKDYDVARFDVPEGELASSLAHSPQDVKAERIIESLNQSDQLICKHLELRLRRKEAAPKGTAGPPAATSPEKSLDIETAHATGPDGLVILTSDAEHLTAKGNDFFYDAGKLLTILKGQPLMEADKDQNVIRARELHIQEHKPAQAGGKPYQTATGIGPGTVDLIDKESNPYRKVMRAAWRDTLVSTKDGARDLLTFTGDASFLDYEHDQTLRADTLKVWLQPKDGAAAAPAPATTAAAQPPAQKAPRPDRLEAIGNVTADSAELKIHDTGRLVVWFKDVPADGKLPAAVAAGQGTGQARGPLGVPTSVTRPVPAGNAATTRTNPATANGRTIQPSTVDFVGPPKPADPPRPIDLSACSVEAWVLRCDGRNVLDKLWTEGNKDILVRVKQAPAKPDEKGVDIAGETLQMNCHPEGNYLVVTGDLAQLRMDKIFIAGPDVTIDQATNKAWVNGAGGMVMESKTNFQGDQLSKPVPLEVQWQKAMLFDGNYAEFHESVQAVQENAHLNCSRLDVYFDRPISLKEGAKGDQPPARVKNLVCDHNVRIDEETKTGEKVVKYQSLNSPAVSMWALEPDDEAAPSPPRNGASDHGGNAGNEVKASGPGALRIWQAGTDATEPAAPASAAKNKRPNDNSTEQMKLTYVTFEKSMYANSKKNKAIFYENVRVLNFPCDNPLIQVDFDTMLEQMPEGGIYLRCEQMEVLTRPVKGGKSHQEMTAVGRVTVQSKNVSGHAAKVTYNEEKDQLIFEGGEDGYATLYKSTVPGKDREKVEAKKITYIRKTGDCSVEHARSLMGG